MANPTQILLFYQSYHRVKKLVSSFGMIFLFRHDRRILSRQQKAVAFAVDKHSIFRLACSDLRRGMSPHAPQER
jgi:hypothetical protein